MIPARWRIGLGREVYIAPSTQGGLLIMSQQQFQTLRNRAGAVDATEEEKADFERYLEYNSEMASLDGQGRINLNDALLNRGGIRTGAEVVLKMRSSGIEVFHPERWTQVHESHRPSYEKVGRKAGL